MSAAALRQLLTEEFAVKVGFLLPSPALRQVLLVAREVQEVRAALAEGSLREEDLREWVSSLLGELRAGERFPHDLAVAALAVTLEDRPTAFADEFLQDLARLETAEMSTSIRVARECLKYRVAAEPVRDGPAAAR
jgi:hypothetical protein